MRFWDPGVYACLPGDEIPEWFSHQSDGFAVHIKLPRQWHNDNCLGFALCAVVRYCHRSHILCYKLNLKANNDTLWYAETETEGFPSDHLLM